ncbi:hypothetical protein NC651_036433 [Populus alba x Populus x berolinensis]|nr:hypothetical protein NC651_036433 [Populus alba x Populus x berolinensis]
MDVPRHGALDRNQIAHLKVLRLELLARNLHCVKSGSAFESELLAVREALKLAWDKGLKRVIVESDSESVVKRICNQLTRQPKNQIEAVIFECQSYVSREWNCFLQHAHREDRNGRAPAWCFGSKSDLVFESAQTRVVGQKPPLILSMSSSLLSRHKTWDSLQKKPPLGFVKLNTDASYKYNYSRSSVAGVCRDEHGIWLFGFSSSVKSGSAFESELLAVREALKLAWDKGLKSVIVESDSKSVVKRICNQLTRRPKNQIEAVILEC